MGVATAIPDMAAWILVAILVVIDLISWPEPLGTPSHLTDENSVDHYRQGAPAPSYGPVRSVNDNALP